MTGPEDLRGRLPNTPTVRELKSARLNARISLRYISVALGLDVETLAAVEDGELRAQDQLLVEWALVILRAPRPSPLVYRVTRRPLAIFVILVLAVAFVIGCVVFMHGGK